METYNTQVTNGVSIAYKHIVVTADDTAGTLLIDFNIDKAIGAVVQILRAGVNVMEDAIITFPANGQVVVSDGGATYALTADDVIYIIASALPL